MEDLSPGRLQFRASLPTLKKGSIALLFCTATLNIAHAFVLTKDTDGHVVKWKNSSTKLNLVGNPSNQSGFSGDAFFNAVVRSLSRWKSASNGSVDFDYWQGSNSRDYETNSEFDGRSSLYFSSAASAPIAGLNENVLGITQVWYDTKTGEVLETDIAINDQQYEFTTQVSDTSSLIGQLTPGKRPTVFIENVLTHELGHAFGLSHSGSMQSAMLYVESPEQARPSCDDLAAIRNLYPRGSGRGASQGTLQGRILAPNGQPVFGAQVSAISLSKGAVLASALSEQDGNYEIPELPTGEYAVMIEPYYAGASALPAHYSGIQSRICPGGKSFSRSFLLDPASTSRLRTFALQEGQIKTTGSISVECTGNSYLAAVPNSPQPVDFSELNLGAIVGKFSEGSSQSIPLGVRQGDLHLRSLSFSLYSPISLRLALYNSAGAKISTITRRPVYSSQSGFRNYDSSLIALGLPPDTYTLQVDSTGINGLAYPAGNVALDGQDFAIIALGSAQEFGPVDTALYPDNARCTQEDIALSYQSPRSLPARTNDKGGNGFGFCGSRAEAATQGTPIPYSTSDQVGWFLTWILPGLISFSLKLARKRLGVYSEKHEP